MAHDGVWFATRGQIAVGRDLHRRYERPSEMTRDRFVALRQHLRTFPRIAEGTFDLELGPAHDSALGLRAGGSSAAPRPRPGSACCAPIPTLPASSPPPAA